MKAKIEREVRVICVALGIEVTGDELFVVGMDSAGDLAGAINSLYEIPIPLTAFGRLDTVSGIVDWVHWRLDFKRCHERAEGRA